MKKTIVFFENENQFKDKFLDIKIVVGGSHFIFFPEDAENVDKVLRSLLI